MQRAYSDRIESESITMPEKKKNRIFLVYRGPGLKSGQIVGVWSGSPDQTPFVKAGLLLLEVENADLAALKQASVSNGVLVNG